MENLETENSQKTYVLYDRSELNPGYFIITEEEGEVVQFIRLGTLTPNGKDSSPVFCIRGYQQQKCMTYWNGTLMKIDFTVEKEHSLYKSLHKLAKSLVEHPFFSMNTLDQSNDALSASFDKDTVTITMSKDPSELMKPTRFIDILLGNAYTCEFYNEILEFYENLAAVSIGETNEKGMEKIISMK